jgi:hypothetical protein
MSGARKNPRAARADTWVPEFSKLVDSYLCLGEGGSNAAATVALTTEATATGRDVHQSHWLNHKRLDAGGQARAQESAEVKVGLKRKPTQRGGGRCVGIPVKQRSGWTSL